MPTLLIATMAACVAALSLWGWGWALRTWARKSFGVPLTIALGLAGTIALGGVLNLLRVAYPRVLDGVVLLGLGLAGLGIRAAARAPRVAWPAWRGALVASVPLGAVGVFAGWHLLPWSAYNMGDDFEKYFAHPVRMIATGTLAPNFLGPLGGETLGGQAWLHAFALTHFPISYLGAVDTFFCSLLCLALAAFAAPVGRWGIGGAMAAVSVATITPQIVNVSALFSGALLVMAAVLLGSDAAGGERRTAVLMGSIYAALLALKTTFAVFVGLHLLALPLVAGLARKKGWLGAAIAAGATAVFLAPWLALHAPLYLTKAGIAVPEIPPHEGTSLRDLFLSPTLNNYGISQLQATVVVATVLLLAIVATVAKRRMADARLVGIAAAGFAILAGYVGTMLANDRYGSDASSATRYLTPMLLGVLPAQLALLRQIPGWARRAEIASAGLALGFLGLFWSPLQARVDQIRTMRTPVVWLTALDQATQSAVLNYNRRVLNGFTASTVRSIQELVPPGEPLGAWIMTAYVLDFARNPIHHADPAGLVMPWTRIPEGTRYFLLEYGGFAGRTTADFMKMATSQWPAERRIGEAELAFARELNDRMRRSTVLYNDGAYLLMRLKAEE